MRTKYLNEGIIRNQKLKVSFTKNGEMIRLLYGSVDYKQFIDTFHTGLKINDSRIIYLHEDINNTYKQYYIENTNVLQTDIYNSYFKVRIIQTDFVPIDENFLVKKYIVKNENNIDLNINFLVYSKVFANLNNDTSGYVKNDTLIQYNHDYSVCTFSNQKLLSRQVNGVCNNFSEGKIAGKDYIGMSNDSAISYDLNVLKPGEEKEITIFVYINKNEEKSLITELEDEIDRIKKLDTNLLMNDTENYWKKIIETHDILEVNKKDIDIKIKNIYNRTILLLPLLINQKTGGISAGIEVDEGKTKCGRYSYFWPRDAVFITKALDIVGMKDISEKFYSEFCKMTQNRNGMWEQRFYTDGRLAPSWGYQVDESASVIFGAYDHFEFTKDKTFLKENLKMFENAISFLNKYLDDILLEKYEMPKSYDLWEEFEGVSLYSMSCIYGAFSSMIKIYDEVREFFCENELRIKEIDGQKDKLQNRLLEIIKYSTNTFFDDSKNIYVRNLKDGRVDISLVGAVVPFKMISFDDKIMKYTIEKINVALKTYTGGYIRYEGDGYMGGNNPWPIATLWMAWYYLEIGDKEKALECFNFVTNSASEHGFLGEQVNNEEMKPMWVIGLTWSHAMYLIILEKLMSN